MRKEHDSCTVEGCTRAHKARGYCQTHYAQFARGQPITPGMRTRVLVKPEVCEVEECGHPVKSKGLCQMHYARNLRHGYVRRPDRTKPFAECRIHACEGKAYSKSLCHAHYIKEAKWKAFGVDADRYQEMLTTQGNVCAVCKRPERAPDKATRRTKDLAIDHDHTTGRVRGLLCSHCNRAIGLLDDNPKIFRAALAYLCEPVT